MQSCLSNVVELDCPLVEWYLLCYELWNEGLMGTWWNISCTVPLFVFSSQFKIRRLRSWLDHGSGPSQYRIIRKCYPIWFGFLCWLINHTSFPYISMYFFHENRLSWLEFHCEMVGSTRLSFDQFLANPGCFHRLPNTGWNLRKWGSWLASCENLQRWWTTKLRTYVLKQCLPIGSWEGSLSSKRMGDVVIGTDHKQKCFPSCQKCCCPFGWVWGMVMPLYI